MWQPDDTGYVSTQYSQMIESLAMYNDVVENVFRYACDCTDNLDMDALRSM